VFKDKIKLSFEKLSSSVDLNQILELPSDELIYCIERIKETSAEIIGYTEIKEK
jgi:hypothetical protein